jgi:ABC-type phosphate/phosphonate transport system substrate-binding protein
MSFVTPTTAFFILIMKYIVLTHSNPLETDRIERLKGFLYNLSESNKQKINRLHDHKGCVEVYVNTKEIDYTFIKDIEESWKSFNEFEFKIIFDL